MMGTTHGGSNLRMSISCSLPLGDETMQAVKARQIVNISSSRVWEGIPTAGTTPPQKAGVIRPSLRALAREVGEFGIT